ncbi:AAA domain-containing protein [Acidithrix ferrooxidans]
MDGPPSTGKSKTIPNLIASLAARGRKILFIAERRAAIDAVVDRL